MHKRRGVSESGPQPLSYELMQGWCNLYRVRLSLWELDAIEALDALWLTVVQEKADG